VYSSAAGDKTIAEAFDGVVQLFTAAKTDTSIAAGKNNYTALTGAFSTANILARLSNGYRALSPLLRASGVKLFISMNLGDMYDDAYQAEHDNPPFVDQSGQMWLDKTQRKCEIVRLPNMPDGIAFFTTKENFRYGYDKESDMKKIVPFVINPYRFTAAMKYVWGVQFHTFSNRAFYLLEVTA
jgi:hypothetical protein